jgi:hypothetical protein
LYDPLQYEMGFDIFPIIKNPLENKGPQKEKEK